LFDSRTGCRKFLWKNRWLPLGDAAFMPDPLSGSGLSRALLEAAGAVSSVDEYLKTGSTAALSAQAGRTSREFASGLAATCDQYGRAAAYYFQHEFWQRRLGRN
jgi:flavin-dependent dehydrogenase